MQTQLIEIVEKTTKQISSTNQSKNSGEQLVALVNSVILQFYSVVDAHQLFLCSLDKVVDQQLLANVNKYDLKYVWENIESIVSNIYIFKNYFCWLIVEFCCLKNCIFPAPFMELEDIYKAKRTHPSRKKMMKFKPTLDPSIRFKQL